PFFNKCKKADEILPSDPNFKVLIHFNHSDDTSFNISAKRSIIPSDIMLKVVGTNTYINKDNRIWIQSVYACKNLSDENRLKQIVYKSSYSDMGQLLAELKGQSVNPSISAK
ncbi:MAG: hypothetical protein J1E85_10635, partial [Ruminococcus sp.]|nr:hypothetical protein [Ruminococcus sp.]